MANKRKPHPSPNAASPTEKPRELDEVLSEISVAITGGDWAPKKRNNIYTEIINEINYRKGVSESEFIQSITEQFQKYTEQSGISDEGRILLADAIHSELLGDETAGFPRTAPALWQKRTTGRQVSPIDFILTHYGQWLDKGFNRQDLRKLDQKLYAAFATWTARHGVPGDLTDFASHRSDRVASELRQAGITKPTDAYKKFPDDRHKAERLYQAAKRHL